MSGAWLRFAVLVLAAIVLTACGKSEEKNTAATPAAAGTSNAETYGKEDAECFAGIVRTVDAKQIPPESFRGWRDRLEGRNRDWLTGFSAFHSNLTNVLQANMGKTPEELRDAGLISEQQLRVVNGYLAVSLENDAQKAESRGADACASIGFTNLADLK